MQNATKPATATANVTAPIAATKPATAKPATANASPRATALALHDKAGFTGGNYTGLSKTRNGGNVTAPNVQTSKATKRDHAALTPRMLSTLHNLAATYGATAFPLPGIDRGQCAIFIVSGFITATGATGKLSAECLKRYAPAKPAKA